MTDIVELLDELGDYKHDDHSVAHEGRTEIQRLRAERDALLASTASVQSDQRAAIDQARELLRIVTDERDALRAANRDCMNHYEQARADMDALLADAERYRWLFRDDGDSVLARVSRVYYAWWDGQSDWRAAIDAAMAAQTTGTPPEAEA